MQAFLASIFSWPGPNGRKGWPRRATGRGEIYHESSRPSRRALNQACNLAVVRLWSRLSVSRTPPNPRIHTLLIWLGATWPTSHGPLVTSLSGDAPPTASNRDTTIRCRNERRETRARGRRIYKYASRFMPCRRTFRNEGRPRERSLNDRAKWKEFFFNLLKGELFIFVYFCKGYPCRWS